MEESLKSVNLFNGGLADKQAGKYSGGMKRRLSVAISLIGDPKVCLNMLLSLLGLITLISDYVTVSVYYPRRPDTYCTCCTNCTVKFRVQVVYMDEPSSGLDPASRNHLWNVVKAAKQERAILLTSSVLPLFESCIVITV